MSTTSAEADLTELRKQRDYCARLCADLLHHGHVAEARKWAKESERFAVQIRSCVLGVVA